MSIIPNPAPYKPTSLFSHALAPNAADAPLLFDPSSQSTSTEMTSQLGEIDQLFNENVILAQEGPSSDTSYIPLWGGHRSKQLAGVVNSYLDTKASTKVSTLFDRTIESSSAIVTTPSEGPDDDSFDALTPEEKNKQLQLKFCKNLLEYSLQTVNLGTAELARKALKAHIKEEVKKFEPNPFEIIIFFIKEGAWDMMIYAIADYFFPDEPVDEDLNEADDIAANENPIAPFNEGQDEAIDENLIGLFDEDFNEALDAAANENLIAPFEEDPKDFIGLAYKKGRGAILDKLLVKEFDSQTFLNYVLKEGPLEVLNWIDNGDCSKLEILANGNYRLNRLNYWEFIHGMAHFVAFNGRIDILKWLATHPNEQLRNLLSSNNDKHRSIAHYAALGGQKEVLEWLATHPNEQLRNLLASNDNQSLNIAHYAAMGGQKEVLEWLATHPNEQLRNLLASNDIQSLNTAYYAAKNGHTHILDWMMTQPNLEHLITNPTISLTQGRNIAAAALQGMQVQVLNWIICHPSPDVRELLHNVRKTKLVFLRGVTYCSYKLHDEGAEEMTPTSPVNIFAWAMDYSKSKIIESMVTSPHEDISVFVEKYIKPSTLYTDGLVQSFKNSSRMSSTSVLLMLFANSPNPAYRLEFIKLSNHKGVIEELLNQDKAVNYFEELLNSPYEEIRNHMKQFKKIGTNYNLAHLAAMKGQQKVLELILKHPDEEVRDLFFVEVPVTEWVNVIDQETRTYKAKQEIFINGVFRLAQICKHQELVNWLKNHQNPKVRSLTVESLEVQLKPSWIDTPASMALSYLGFRRD